MSDPISRMIDAAVRCLTCGLSMADCLASGTCNERCTCGWFTKVGQPCRNPETARCSTKTKYGKYNRKTRRYE